MFSLEGKTAFITGGTSGIGLAVAERIKSVGGEAAVVGRRNFQAEAEERGLVFLQADVTDEQQLVGALDVAREKLGELDVLMLNAGMENSGTMLEEHSMDEFRAVLAVNLDHVYCGLHHGPARMRDGGSIINTSSVSGLLSVPTYAQYCATKAAVNSLTKTAALELAPRGIRVNAVCPGSIRTEMLPPDHPEIPIVEALAPMGRVGDTDDVVGLYHFLASDDSRYITGQTICVDGGVMAGVSFGMLEAIEVALEAKG
jgi:NAD(P)-dependent dehydrogenase (short-subunit alcohol dehydrogenase family)